jgi:hypothetical protein
LHSALQSALQAQLDRKQQKGKQKAEDLQAGWRSIRALGKLYNIAIYIRSSTLLSNTWEDLVGRVLGIDNTIYWNSWYKLLYTALDK